MNIDKLFKSCVYFEKLAQQIPKYPTTKNSQFWNNLLLHAVQSYAQFLSSPQKAYQIFNEVADYHKAPATASNEALRQLDAIEAGISEAVNKITAQGLNPIDVLSKLGLANMNSNSLNIMNSNLEILQKGVDFNKYQHFVPGQTQALQSSKYDPGY